MTEASEHRLFLYARGAMMARATIAPILEHLTEIGNLSARDLSVLVSGCDASRVTASYDGDAYNYGLQSIYAQLCTSALKEMGVPLPSDAFDLEA